MQIFGKVKEVKIIKKKRNRIVKLVVEEEKVKGAN